MVNQYKFQKLEVYHLALSYLDLVYSVVFQLPNKERFNISSQAIRAATSIPLNIAEGSTGQSNSEQARFLSIAIRSYLETIACLDLIERRDYVDMKQLPDIRRSGHHLFVKLVAFRKMLTNK